jgi:MOSC domain-containing protein YiiM
MAIDQRPLSELEADLDRIRTGPAEAGTVELIVRRPAEERRELLEVGELDLDRGLVGDMWSRRPSSSTDDGGPNPEAQVTVMSARAAALVAGDDRADWAQAGDQLYVDFDLSQENLSPGTLLKVGEAVLEVRELPHLGCGKFARRFGVDALKLVNSDEGRALRLRGVNTRVVEPGAVRPGDRVAKHPPGR